MILRAKFQKPPIRELVFGHVKNSTPPMTPILNCPNSLTPLRPKKLLLFLAFLSASIVNEETRVWASATTSPQQMTGNWTFFQKKKNVPGDRGGLFGRTLKMGLDQTMHMYLSLYIYE